MATMETFLMIAVLEMLVTSHKAHLILHSIGMHISRVIAQPFAVSWLLAAKQKFPTANCLNGGGHLRPFGLKLLYKHTAMPGFLSAAVNILYVYNVSLELKFVLSYV